MRLVQYTIYSTTRVTERGERFRVLEIAEMPDINSVPGEARGAQGASAGEAQVSRQGSTTVSRRASQICEFISTYALGYGLGSTLNEGVWSGTRSRCFGGQRLGGPPQTPIRMFEQRCSFNVATLFTLYLSRSITSNNTNNHRPHVPSPPPPRLPPKPQPHRLRPQLRRSGRPDAAPAPAHSRRAAPRVGERTGSRCEPPHAGVVCAEGTLRVCGVDGVERDVGDA